MANKKIGDSEYYGHCLACGYELSNISQTVIGRPYGGDTQEVAIKQLYCNFETCSRYGLLTALGQDIYG